MTDWMGKRPTNAYRLTDEWIKAAVSSGAIVPPYNGVDGPSWVARGIMLVLLLCMFVSVGVAFGWRA